VVERELMHLVASHAIDAAVANVGNQYSLRQQHQRARGGAHVAEVDVDAAATVDLGVRFRNGAQQRFRRAEIGVLVKQVRDAFHRELAGQFAASVSPHAVGHDEHMPALLPGFFGVR
jgi:hypothetical protein